MRTYFIVIIYFLLLLLAANTVYAEPDLFGEYNAAIRKKADAKTVNVYNAWGNNMANMIEEGIKDGIVIDGTSNKGLGNVYINKNANVGTVINNTNIQGTTVINKKNTSTNRW